MGNPLPCHNADMITVLGLKPDIVFKLGRKSWEEGRADQGVYLPTTPTPAIQFLRDMHHLLGY